MVVFVSKAAPIAQRDTAEIANVWANGDTIVTTSPLGRTFTVTIGSLITTAQVAQTYKEAFNGETLNDTAASVDVNPQKYGEFNELTATVSGSTVTISTNDSLRGWPFTVTSINETTAGTGTLTHNAAATAAVSPWDISLDANWDTGTAPVSTDDILFDGRGSHALFGVDQSAIDPASIVFDSTWDKFGGLPPINMNNPSYPFLEYRPRWVQYGGTPANFSVTIGHGSGAGTSRLWLDVGDAVATFNVFKTSSRERVGIPAVVLAGSGENALNHYRGDVGGGLFGKAFHLATIRQHYLTNPRSDALLQLGAAFQTSGTPDYKFLGGQALLEAGSGTTLLEAIGAIVSLRGGTYTTVHSKRNDASGIDGLVLFENAAALTNLECFPGGVADFSGNQTGKTLTTCKLHEGSSFIDPRSTIAFSAANGIEYVGSPSKTKVVRAHGEKWRLV